jgi:hypothetical protein
MKDEFLDILLKEERLLANQIKALQSLIKIKGGESQYHVDEVEKTNFSNFSTINTDWKEVFPKGDKNYDDAKSDSEKAISIILKNKFNFVVRPNGYNTGWIWEKKTKFAFEFFKRKGYPKQIIDFIIEQEDIDNSDNNIKNKIANNIYNAISNLNKKEYLIKDEETGKYEVLTIKKDGIESSLDTEI